MTNEQLRAIVTELCKEREFFLRKLEEVNGVNKNYSDAIVYATSLSVIMAMHNAAKAALNVAIDDNANEVLKGSLPGLDSFLGVPRIKAEKSE